MPERPLWLSIGFGCVLCAVAGAHIGGGEYVAGAIYILAWMWWLK